MSDISENLSSNAQLAQAAYGDLNNLMDEIDVAAVLQKVSAGAGMARLQAQEFASRYSIIDNFDDTDTSGFSVTVFGEGDERIRGQILT